MFHRRIRLPDADAIPGWKQEHDGLVHRSYDDGPDGAGFVETPRGLGDDPDAVIAAQVAFFRDRGLPFEWKTYAYDEPADLGERLLRAGFSREEPETLILGEVDRILERPSALPSKVRLREADGPADYRRIAVLTDTLWHNGLDRIAERLAGEARMFPDRLSVFLVEDALKGPDGPAVCGRVGPVPPGDRVRQPVGWRNVAGVAAAGAVQRAAGASGPAGEGAWVRVPPGRRIRRLPPDPAEAGTPCRHGHHAVRVDTLT